MNAIVEIGATDNMALSNYAEYIRAAFFPVIPLLTGACLKISIIDNVQTDPFSHIEANYFNGVWIELISISFIASISWGYANKNADAALKLEALILLIIYPIVIFIICLLLSLGLPKFGILDKSFTIFMPFALGMIALCSTSIFIRRLSIE